MNKWQIICPVVLLAVVAAVMVHQQGAEDGRVLAHAVIQKLDRNSSGIATLLARMKTNDMSSVEDAVFHALQNGHSTSLITRADVHVVRASDGTLECMVDTSRWGVSTRTIR